MNRPTAIPYFVVDAFTDRPFTGNPAAVVILDRWPSNGYLQSVAAEMNLSETAFLVRSGDVFELRWLTPKVEVDLCGHATLASAFVLRHAKQISQGANISFSTRSGLLTATSQGEMIELDFPLDSQSEVSPCPELIAALGIRPTYTGQGRFDYLIEIESEAALRAMTPDFNRLALVACRGVIVTARSSNPSFDFVSRFFAPAAGIDEDPVTGSAHCTLADFWHRRLGKREFLAYQASSRGGVLRVRLAGNRVLLGGSAVLIAQGQLAVGPA